MSPIPATRLAPSPTGALHLGNARTFLINWVLARQNNWRVLLRIDDLEGPRIKPGAQAQVIEDLAWLGLDWEEPVIRQSQRTAAYKEALDALDAAGFVYPCTCTRSEISAIAAGRVEPDQGEFYPGTCRGRHASLDEALRTTGRPPAIRFRVPAQSIIVPDQRLEMRTFRGQHDLGDFIVRKSDGEFGYQLANVVDDIDLGITHVVRGEDLLASAPRQMLLYEALGMGKRIPAYIHLPLVAGPDGRKLAKRHGDTRISQLRQEGISAGRIRHMLATWSGWNPTSEETSIAEWIDRFDLARLPAAPVAYDDAHDRPRPALRGVS